MIEAEIADIAGRETIRVRCRHERPYPDPDYYAWVFVPVPDIYLRHGGFGFIWDLARRLATDALRDIGGDMQDVPITVSSLGVAYFKWTQQKATG